jgi:hypothetical protein
MTTTATSFEEPRMEIGRAAPPLHRALVTLGNEVELDTRLRELVNLGRSGRRRARTSSRTNSLTGVGDHGDQRVEPNRDHDADAAPSVVSDDRAQSRRCSCSGGRAPADAVRRQAVQLVCIQGKRDGRGRVGVERALRRRSRRGRDRRGHTFIG